MLENYHFYNKVNLTYRSCETSILWQRKTDLFKFVRLRLQVFGRLVGLQGGWATATATEKLFFSYASSLTLYSCQ